MKKVFSIAALPMLFALFTSCKKDDEPTRSELLIGTWHLSAWGADANMNGTLETSEYQAIPSGSNIVETFNSDHTGTAVITNAGTTNTGTFTWQFQNNDQQIVVTATGATSSSTSQITVLTSTQLMAYDIANSPRTIILLVK